MTVIDFMRPRSGHSLRLSSGGGRPDLYRAWRKWQVRFDYGLSVPWISPIVEGLLHAIAGPYLIVINGGTALSHSHGTVKAEFTVTAGQTVPFVIVHNPSHDPARLPVSASAGVSGNRALLA